MGVAADATSDRTTFVSFEVARYAQNAPAELARWSDDFALRGKNSTISGSPPSWAPTGGWSGGANDWLAGRADYNHCFHRTNFRSVPSSAGSWKMRGFSDVVQNHRSTEQAQWGRFGRNAQLQKARARSGCADTNPKRKRGAAKTPFLPRSRVGLVWQNYWNGPYVSLSGLTDVRRFNRNRASRSARKG